MMDNLAAYNLLLQMYFAGTVPEFVGKRGGESDLVPSSHSVW